MSPNERDRAREKRRYEKRQTSLDKRRANARRNKQVLGVVIAIVVIVGGLVGLSFALKKDDKTGGQASSAATPATRTTPTPNKQPSVPAKNVVAGCVTPPKVPSDQRTGTLPDKKTAAGKTFIATVTTNCGVITMELDGTNAPQTVASFLSLANSGYWADSPCHRLTASATLSVLQCGDPTGTGSGNPGYGFGVENAPKDFTFPPGTLAMARTQDPLKGNGGQFFIVYKQTKLEDPAGYSIFGKITSGMKIVDKVAAAGVSPDPSPKQPISILTVKVAEKKARQ